MAILNIAARLFVNVNKIIFGYANFVHDILLNLNPLTAKLFNLNCHPLEVVSRWRDPQLQVGANYSDLTKRRSILFKTCWLMSHLSLTYLKCGTLCANKKWKTRIYATPALKGLKKCDFIPPVILMPNYGLAWLALLLPVYHPLLLLLSNPISKICFHKTIFQLVWNANWQSCFSIYTHLT